MKQILQNLKTGDTVIEDIPCPSISKGNLLIRTSKTLVSAGTERMLVDFGKASLMAKARQQPDKVRQVMDKIKTDGLVPTYQAVQSKLDQPLPMGYCNVGSVVEIGDGVEGFKVGDRVVSNGKHSEFVRVPQNLCARIPEEVDDDQAVFTVIAAIAVQGIRLLNPTLGEAFVVTGLGLIGLVAVQLLKAHGCRVLGIDLDADKIAMAKSFGADVIDLSTGEDPLQAASSFSRGNGVDGVLITASTASNVPVHQAANMCRKRGRIVLVGVVGLELSRADFYEKELSFQVSCSYGPGRYDPAYEDAGHDYPLPYVRWTEQRNFETILDLLADRKLSLAPLISHRIELDNMAEAYHLVSGGSPLGIVLNFPKNDLPLSDRKPSRTIQISQRSADPSAVRLGFVGAGNYASQVLIPAFAETRAQLLSVASSTGTSSTYIAKKYKIDQSTTDTDSIFADPEINALVITTRHDSHIDFVKKGLEAGKHIFVEKPLVISRAQMDELLDVIEKSPRQLLMVGFNRRFAPQIVKIKELLAKASQPKAFVMTVNAGQIPRDHWTQDPAVGGGRIIGEGCHFIDLLRFLADSPITRAQANCMKPPGAIGDPNDTVSISLSFEDGSVGTVHYFANGHRSFSKERLEVFCGNKILQLDNFRKLKGFNWPGFNKMNLIRQDKGNKACAGAFIAAIEKGAAAPIAFSELVEVTNACFDVIEQI